MTAVIISYWANRPKKALIKLLRQLDKSTTSTPFETVVVCNGGNARALDLEQTLFPNLKLLVLNRENFGYNIGAWEHGWRNLPMHDYYMFLQDECYLKTTNWLDAYITKMRSNAQIGLLGESLNWGRPWSEQRLSKHAITCLNTDDKPPFNSVDYLHNYIKNLGIPPGETAVHLQTLVLFTSGDILERVNGFNLGATYSEAVGTEIGFSKKVMAIGRTIELVGDQPFSNIGHTQWSDENVKRWTKFRLTVRSIRARFEKMFDGFTSST